MTKATHNPTTGERAVALEILSAGPGRPGTAPGLTLETDRNRSAKADSEDGSKASLASGDISPETAAAAVALTSPSILDLGKHLAAVEVAHEAFDNVNMGLSLKAGDKAGEVRSRQRHEAAWTILEDRAEALREMISSMPALTIQDAAVQIGVICTASSRLSASVHTANEATAIADRIERMALGMLPIVAKVAGLDMEAMDWADGDALRVWRFDGVGVTL